MLLGLGASEPVLLCNALRVGIDAGLAGGEVAEDLDGVIGATLVGVNPVESYKKRSNGCSFALLYMGSKRHLNHTKCRGIFAPLFLSY